MFGSCFMMVKSTIGGHLQRLGQTLYQAPNAPIMGLHPTLNYRPPKSILMGTRHRVTPPVIEETSIKFLILCTGEFSHVIMLLHHLIGLSLQGIHVEHLQQCSVCDSANVFFTSEFSYLLFCNSTHKYKLPKYSESVRNVTEYVSKSVRHFAVARYVDGSNLRVQSVCQRGGRERKREGEGDKKTKILEELKSDVCLNKEQRGSLEPRICSTSEDPPAMEKSW